jgi:hypothetical protein
MATGKGAGKTYREWFWEGVDIPPGADRKPCWLWTRCTYPKGYGAFKRTYAHRVAYQLEHGPIPKGMVVMHGCDNPNCCNPFHLSAGTQQDNIEDAKQKFRAKGTKPKLTLSEVKKLRELAASKVPYDDLEKMFSLNRASLHDAVTGKTYRWVQ